MFLRCHRRKKDGKEHRYYSVEESRRLQSGKVVQRRVLYLGEINDSQQASWRKTLEVFDEQQQRSTTLSLFPEDRPVPADVLDTIQVKLSAMQVRRARRLCCKQGPAIYIFANRGTYTLIGGKPINQCTCLSRLVRA
jgi:hypothetical protein